MSAMQIAGGIISMSVLNEKISSSSLSLWMACRKFGELSLVFLQSRR